MPTLSCLCGDIRLTLAKRPDFIHACNCTLCSKTGARWGYFQPSEVTVAGETKGYCRADKVQPNAEVRFCPRCGATTHFVLTAAAAAKFGNVVMGVNMLLAEPDALAGIELRYPDGRAWRGEGPFGYVRQPRILGAEGGVEP
ncbi:MAG: aldehyde-activating protein [Alphaproteobacteria bacterium]|nr:aldehyde-activating protein [Alphaproteobacteria bacterium]